MTTDVCENILEGWHVLVDRLKTGQMSGDPDGPVLSLDVTKRAE